LGVRVNSSFTLTGIDEAVNSKGVRVYIPPGAWSQVVYETPEKTITLRFISEHICEGTILCYLFIIPSNPVWDVTDTPLTEAEKDAVSSDLTKAFSLFGGIGVRFDEETAHESKGVRA